MAHRSNTPADYASEEEDEHEGSSDDDEDTVERKGTGAEAGTSGRASFTRIARKTSYSKLQTGETLDRPPFRVTRERPMMEYETGKGEWFQVNVIGESANELFIRFPATHEHNTSEHEEWIAKTSSRFWRGSNKGKYWKHVGDGAWHPKGNARGKAKPKKSRRKAKSGRASQGEMTEGTGTTRASGDGDDGFSSPRLVRASKASTPEISDGEEEEPLEENGQLSDTMDRDTHMLGSSGGRSSPDELQDNFQAQPSEQPGIAPLAPGELGPIKNWFFNHLQKLHAQQRINREGPGTSAEAGTIPEHMADALNSLSDGHGGSQARGKKRSRAEAAQVKGQADSAHGKDGSSSSGSAGHVQEGGFQSPEEAAARPHVSGSDEAGPGQRRQPISTREIANLLQSPWGWAKDRGRKREGSHSESEPEEEEEEKRSRSPSPATPVRQRDRGPTHRQRSSSADGEAKLNRPQAAARPAGERKGRQEERPAAVRPVSAPLQAKVKADPGQQQRSASPAPRGRPSKDPQAHRPSMAAKELKLVQKNRTGKGGSGESRREGSAKPKAKGDLKTNGGSREAPGKPKGGHAAVLKGDGSGKTNGGEPSKPRGENPSRPAKGEYKDPSKAKAAKRPGDAVKLKGGSGKLPGAGKGVPCPVKIREGNLNPKALGAARTPQQSAVANGVAKALKAGMQNGHRRSDGETVLPVLPQKRPAEVAAPVLMATDVFEELGAKKLKATR